jgi:transcriptional regulator with XRE-family HTH domain
MLTRKTPQRSERQPRRKVEYLHELRTWAGMSQEELAARLGMRQSTISKLERRENPSFFDLRAYVAALGGELRVEARFAGRTFEFEGGVDEPPPSG